MNETPTKSHTLASNQIGFVDSSLCAAQLALWDGAQSDDRLLPIIERLDQAGFAAIDILDGELCERVAETGIDPWRRLRIAAARARATPLNVWVSARTGLGQRVLSPDLLDLGIAALIRAGARRITCYDAVNDATAISTAIQSARRAGVDACAALIHADSPHYDESYFASRAQSLDRAGVKAICLVDPVGCLTPEETFRLIGAIRRAVAITVAVEFRAPCRSGVAEMCYFEAVRAGARLLHTCTDALSGSASLPSSAYFAEHVRRFDMQIDAHPDVLDDVNDYFGAVAEAFGLPIGVHGLPDASAARFQVPAVLVSQFSALVAAAGVSPETIFLESLSVRRHFGDPTMARPLGALVLRQALLNVTSAQPFQMLRSETSTYVQGRYGTPPGPISASVRSPTLKKEISDLVLDRTQLVKDLGETISDEDLLLAAWFGREALERIHDGRRNPGPEPVHAASPLQFLKQRLDRQPRVRSIVVRKGDVLFESRAKSTGGNS